MFIYSVDVSQTRERGQTPMDQYDVTIRGYCTAEEAQFLMSLIRGQVDFRQEVRRPSPSPRLEEAPLTALDAAAKLGAPALPQWGCTGVVDAEFEEDK